MMMALSFRYIIDEDNDVFSQVNMNKSLSGVPDYFDRNKISSGGDLSHYSSASLY